MDGVASRYWFSAPSRNVQLGPSIELALVGQLEPVGERYPDMSWVDRGTIAP